MTDSVILISINSYNIDNVKCLTSLKNIDWDTIDCLIYHSSVDSDIENIQELSKLRGKVKKVIYMNKNIIPLYWCMFTGLDADIYDTDEFFSDSAVISFLVDSYGGTGMTMKSSNADVETLAKCIATISESSSDNLQKMVSNNFWVKTLNTAVSNVDTALTRANKVNIDVVDMLTETTKLISALGAGQESTSRELENLKILVRQMEKTETTARPNVPFIFSTYNVPVTVKKVLYVKAVGNCRFLTSFLIAYQHYLKMKKQYSSKLLLLLPKLKLHLVRYKDIARLAPDSIGIIDLKISDVYHTFEPKKIVMDKFFTQEADIFIVVDLMFGENLVEGHMVETYYAASGVSDVRKFNLKPERSIFSLTGVKNSVILPYIPKYSDTNEYGKKTLYFDTCNKFYALLDEVLIPKGR